MLMPFLTVITSEIAEGVTARITGTILDDTGTPIPTAALTTLKLTLFDKRSLAILNSRSAVSVLNTAGGTVDSNGLLTMILSPADNAIVAQSPVSETHVALFTWTYNAGAATGRAQVEFTIANLSLVP